MPTTRRMNKLLVTPAAAAGATAFRPRFCLVHRESAAAGILTVQSSDGSLRFLVGLHFHKAEALGSSGIAVHDNLSGLHRAVRLEHSREIAIGHRVAEVSDVQLLAHFANSSKKRPLTPFGGVNPVSIPHSNKAHLAQRGSEPLVDKGHGESPAPAPIHSLATC